MRSVFNYFQQWRAASVPDFDFLTGIEHWILFVELLCVLDVRLVCGFKTKIASHGFWKTVMNGISPCVEHSSMHMVDIFSLRCICKSQRAHFCCLETIDMLMQSFTLLFLQSRCSCRAAYIHTAWEDRSGRRLGRQFGGIAWVVISVHLYPAPCRCLLVINTQDCFVCFKSSRTTGVP